MLAGRLVNDLRTLAVTLDQPYAVDVSEDPNDSHLLAIAESGSASFLRGV